MSAPSQPSHNKGFRKQQKGPRKGSNPLNPNKFPAPSQPSSAQWNSFNSRLLQSINQEYKGPFLSKLLTALETYETQQDLSLAISEMFNPSENPVKRPSDFQMQTIGGKTQAIMYFENAIFDILQSKNTQEYNPFYGAPTYNSADPDIQKYLILFNGLLGIPSNGPKNVSIQMSDDLAFMAICGLLEKHTKKRLFAGINWQHGPGINKQFNFTGIDESTVEAINEEGPWQSSTLSRFQYLNGILPPNNTSSGIQAAIPHLLSSSSFIWEDAVFGVDPEGISAMSEEQRVLKLVENQSQCLSAAFNFLRDKLYPVGEPLPKNFANQANELSILLQKQQNLKDKYSYHESKKKSFEDQFSQIQEQMGTGNMESPSDLLDMFVKTSAPSQNIATMSPLSQLIYKTMQGYKDHLIKCTALAADINDNESELNRLRPIFEMSTQDALNSLSINYRNNSDVLAVYTYLSMIFFNKEIFPEANLSEKASKTQLLKDSFSKWRSFSENLGDKNLNTDPTTVFQDILNNKAERILADYRPQTNNYKYKALEDADLEMVVGVTESVIAEAQSGKRSAAKKFSGLKRILEKALLEDNAFAHVLSSHEKFSKEKIASLTAHIQAAKIFADKGDGKSFNSIIQSIVSSVSDSQIRARIVSSNAKLLQAAETLSLTANGQLESFEGELQNIVNKENIQSIRDNATLQAYESGGNQEKIQSQEYIYQKTAEGIMTELSTPGWLADYGVYEQLTRGVLPAENSDILVGNKTYSDGYRAFSLFWDQYAESHGGKDLIKKSLSSQKGKYQIKSSKKILIQALELKAISGRIRFLKEQDLRYKVTTRRELNDKNVDLLQNKTLFKFYQNKYVDTQKNQGLSNEAYSSFLPTFVASFTSVGNLWGAEKLRGYKAQLLEDLPGAKDTFQAIEQWRSANSMGIQKINDWLQTQIEAAGDMESSEAQSALVQELMQKGRSIFQENIVAPMSSFIGGITEQLLYVTTISSGILMGLMKAGVIATAGILGGTALFAVGTLFSLCCGGLLYAKGTDFAKTALQSLLEHAQGFLGMGDYTEDSPLEMIMQLLEQSLINEISSFGKFPEMQHKMNYAFYLQEMFDTLDQMQTDFTTFRERTNSLIPNAKEQSNFSVLACEMFCRSIKDVFLIVPNDILQQAHSMHFPDAVQGYLAGYKLALEQRAEGYQGQKVFPMGFETPFSRFMKKDPLTLTFSSMSPVGKLFGGARNIQVLPERILPYEKIKPEKMSQAVKSFLEKSQNIQVLKQQLDQKMQLVLWESNTASNYERPLAQDQYIPASNAIVSSLQMLRYGLDLARATREIELGLPNDYTEYLKPTGESAQSIMSSKLIRESLSVLKKTATFADALGLESGKNANAMLKEIDFTMKEFLKTGIFNVLPFQVWETLNSSVESMLKSMGDGYPSLSYPVLLELMENKGLLLPQILWTYQRQALGEEGVKKLQEANRSKALYVTNQALKNVFLPNAQTRAFLLSPFLVDQFEKHIINKYTNPGLVAFLGRNSETADQVARINSAPGWFNFFDREASQNARQQQDLQRQQRAQKAPTLRLQPNDGYHVPQQASPVADPNTGLSPQDYDPENVGVQPSQALDYYGDKLSPDVQQKLMQLQGQNVSGISAPQPGQPQISSGGTNMPAAVPNQQYDQSQTQQQGMQMPMIMGMGGMMGNEQQQSQQQTPSDAQTIEIPNNEQQSTNSESGAQNMVGVGADGQSFTYGGGYAENGYDTPRMYAAEAAGPPGPVNDPMIPSMPMPRSGPSFPPAASTPYQNMSTAAYNPAVPETPGFNWQQGLAIGGGLAMGALLLSQMTKGNNNKKRRRG